MLHLHYTQVDHQPSCHDVKGTVAVINNLKIIAMNNNNDSDSDGVTPVPSNRGGGESVRQPFRYHTPGGGGHDPWQRDQSRIPAAQHASLVAAPDLTALGLTRGAIFQDAAGGGLGGQYDFAQFEDQRHYATTPEGIAGPGNAASVAHQLSEANQATFCAIQDLMDDYETEYRRGGQQATNPIYQQLVRLLDRVFGENETVSESAQNSRRIHNVNTAILSAHRGRSNIGDALNDQRLSHEQGWGEQAIVDSNNLPSHPSVRQAQRVAAAAIDAMNRAISSALHARESSAEARTAQVNAMSSLEQWQLVQAWARRMGEQEIASDYHPHQGDQWHTEITGARGREPEGGGARVRGQARGVRR